MVTNLSSQQPKVLVVDDDVMLRMLVRKTLEDCGLQVFEAGNGTEGIEAFKKEKPDIVLLDVLMPDMNGFAACQVIRKTLHGEHVPILMLTGLEDATSIEEAYEAGATDFINKPIAWPLLAHRVRYILRASSAFLDLAKSKEVLANAQRIAGLGSWEWDVINQKINWSEEIFHICGLTPTFEPNLDMFLAIVHKDDKDRVKQSFDNLFKTGGFANLDHRIVMSDNSEKIVHTQGEPAFDNNGKVIRLAGTLQDITERRKAEEQIHYLAFNDSLTGLPNRLWFKEMFKRAESNLDASQDKMGVLCLGLDRFKLINDTLGHSAGDKLLQSVSKRLRNSLRSSDPVAINGDAGASNDIARLGGDEFIILLTDVSDVEIVTMLAGRILDAMLTPFVLGNQEITLTVSIGIAIYPNDGTDFDSLLKNADSALYHAKEQGRSNFQFYAESMNSAAMEKLSLESRLRKAIEREEFELHYQPQVDLRTGRMTGMEALIRWRDPEMGMISPAKFIPLAEETGLIIPIGEWVLRTACSRVKAWHMNGYPELSIAVNFSAKQFRHENVPQLVKLILDQSGLEPRYLEVELTESMLMLNVKSVVDILSELKEIGVRLSLDDFGTGYSSLSYLRRFPIDIIKIDQAFIRDLSKSSGNASLTKAIIAMAHSLNMKTIAEGVETKEQLIFLNANRCDAIQGYYFSRPVPANEMSSLLEMDKKLEEHELAQEGAQSVALILDNDINIIDAVKKSLQQNGYIVKSVDNENRDLDGGILTIGAIVQKDKVKEL